MRAIAITANGGSEVVREVDHQDPNLGTTGVLVEMRGAGVNFAEVLMRRGHYPEAPPPPFVPGYEVAGVVSAIGAEVTRVRPGDRVVAGALFGGWAERCVVPESHVVPLPPEVGFEEAAALPVTYLTAWLALERMARVKAGDLVLIHAAAGGVGSAAVQLAHHRGARVVGTTRSAHKLTALADLGVEHALDTTTTDFVAAVQKLGGADVALDPIGGDHLQRSLDALAPGGRAVLLGLGHLLQGTPGEALRQLVRVPPIRPLALMNQNKGVFGLNLLRLWDDPLLGTWLADIVAAARPGGWVRPVIAASLPLSEAARALELLESSGNVGKVVLHP